MAKKEAKPDWFEKTGLFLGRFQPFHLGHLHVIKQAKQMVDELVIGIGSAQYSHTQENPFTASEREEMIDNTLKAMNMGNYEIVQIEDIEEDGQYVRHVEKYVPDFQLVFAATNKVTEQLFGKKYSVWTCARHKNIESKNIRALMLENDPGWRTMVPGETAKVIDEIEGIGRIRHVHQLL